MGQNLAEGVMPQKYLHVKDLVEETGMSEETIRSYIRRKLLPAIRMGRDYLIDPKDWEEFKRKRRTVDGDEEK
jgi:excisionase family DNA binding protein